MYLFICRVIGEDVIVKDKLIPAGTNVIMAPFLLHRDPKIFPNPDRFIPERFLPENCTKRHPYSYLPFSAGPRNCIGQKYDLQLILTMYNENFRFAMMEEKVIMSSVLRKYQLRTTLKAADVPLLAEVILRPKNGLQISIEKRSV